MSLSTAFSIISSSFAANAAQTAVVSNNIANVNTPGYSREIANVVDQFLRRRGCRFGHSRGQRGAPEQVSTSTSQAATQQAISDGLATLAADRRRQFIGHVDLRREPERRLALGDARQSANRADDLRGSPTSSSAADAVVTAASELASSLNSGSATVQQVREQADQNMASSVDTINSLLEPVHRRQQRRRDRTSDRRQCRERRGHARLDREPARASRSASRPVTAANGSMSIYTDSGVTLFQDPPRTVSFTPTPTLVDGANGARGHRRRRADHRRRVRRCRSNRARSPAMQRCATRSRPNIRPSSTRSRAA